MFSEKIKRTLINYGWYVALEDEDTVLWYCKKTGIYVVLFENKKEDEYHFNIDITNPTRNKIEKAVNTIHHVESHIIGGESPNPRYSHEYSLLLGIIKENCTSLLGKRILTYTINENVFEIEVNVTEEYIAWYLLEMELNTLNFSVEDFNKWLYEMWEDAAYEEYVDFKKKESEEE